MASDEGVTYCLMSLINGDDFAITIESSKKLRDAIYPVEFEEPPDFVPIETSDGNPMDVRVNAIISLVESTPETRRRNMKHNFILEKERKTHHEQVQEEVIREGQFDGPSIAH